MSDDEKIPDYANMTGEEILAYIPPGWDKSIGEMTKEDLEKLAQQEREKAEFYKKRAEIMRAELARRDALDK